MATCTMPGSNKPPTHSPQVGTVRVFQLNTPSVVNITNIRTLQSRWSLDTQQVPAGTGSGFIWDDKGGWLLV